MTLIARAPVISSRNQQNAPTPNRYDSERVIFEGQTFKAPELDKFACVRDSLSTEEIAIFTSVPGNILTSEPQPELRWSRNDLYQTRMRWDESAQSWKLFPGNKPILSGIVKADESLVISPLPQFPLGATLPGTSDPLRYAMIRIGEIPNEESYPVGVGTSFSGILVVLDDDVDTYNFPQVSPPSGVIGVTTGKLALHPTIAQQFAGSNVWYSPVRLFENNPEIADLATFEDSPVFLSPIPSPEEYPHLTLGSRLPLQVTRVSTETELFSLDLASGQAAYAASTGQLRVSRNDINKADPEDTSFQVAYFGTKVAYQGLYVGVESEIKEGTVLQTSWGNYVLPVLGNTDGDSASGVIQVFDGTGIPPKPFPLPVFTPNGSGLVLSVPKGVFYNDNHIVYEFRIGVNEDSPIKGRALIYLAESYSGNSVVVEFSEQDIIEFGPDPILYRSLTYLPSHYFSAGIVSRKRWQFPVEAGDTITFTVNGSRYRWTANSDATYSDTQLASILQQVLPTTVTVTAIVGHVVIQADPAVTVRVAYGYYAGSTLVRDLSGCKALGFLPGWSNKEISADHGYGVLFDIDSGYELAQTAKVEGVVTKSILDTYYTFLRNNPLQDFPGFTSNVYFRVLDGFKFKNLIPYQTVLYLFSENKIAFANQSQAEIFVDKPTSAFSLGQTLVVPNTTTPPIGYLDVSEGEGGYVPATSTYFPQQGSSGTLVITNEIYPVKLRSNQGIITAVTPNILVDTTENFNDVPLESLVIIRSGEAKGVYVVEQVGSFALNIQPPFSVDTNLQGVSYEIAYATNPGLVADVQYQSFSSFTSEPFSVSVVASLGKGKSFYTVPTGTVPGIFSDSTELTVNPLAFFSLGTLSEFMSIPISFSWTTKPFTIQIGSVAFIPVNVLVFTDQPSSVQLRTTDGVLKFGSGLLEEYASGEVYVREVFPGTIGVSTAYVDLSSGQVRTGATGEIFWHKKMTPGSDISVNPANGSFLLRSPLEAGQRILASYWKDDNGQKGDPVSEFLPFFVIGELATRVSSTVFTFNSDNRVLATSVPISVSAGGALQNYGGKEDYKQRGNTLTFNAPIDEDFTVNVTYGVLSSAGGEQTGTVSSPPVWRPPFNVPAGQTSFTVEGLQEFEPGGLLRLGSTIRVIESSTQDQDSTTVVFSPASVVETGSRSPGIDVNTLRTKALPDNFWKPVENKILPVPAKSTDVVAEGNLDVIIGLLLELDGVPYLITGVEKDPEGYSTKMTLGEAVGITSQVPLVRISSRPVYPENSTVFLCPESLMPELGIEVIVISDSGEILRNQDFEVSQSGTIVLKNPLQYSQSLYIRGTQARLLSPKKNLGRSITPKVRTKFTHLTVPSSLGFAGKTLIANYRTYQPDQFGYQLSEYTTLKEIVENEITQSGDAQGVSLATASGFGVLTEYARAESLSEKDYIAAKMLMEVQPVLEADLVLCDLSGEITPTFNFLVPDSDIPARGHFHPMRPDVIPSRVDAFSKSVNYIDDILDFFPIYRAQENPLYPRFFRLTTVSNGENSPLSTMARLEFDDRFDSPVITDVDSISMSTKVRDIEILISSINPDSIRVGIDGLLSGIRYGISVYSPDTETFVPVKSKKNAIYTVSDGTVNVDYATAIWISGYIYDEGGSLLTYEEIEHPVSIYDWKYAITAPIIGSFDLSTQEGAIGALSSLGTYRNGVDVRVTEGGRVVSLKQPFSIFPWNFFVQTTQPKEGEEIEVALTAIYQNAAPIWESVSGVRTNVYGTENQYVSDFQASSFSRISLANAGASEYTPIKVVTATIYAAAGGTSFPNEPAVIYCDTTDVTPGNIMVIGVGNSAPNGLMGFHTISSVNAGYVEFPRLPVDVENLRMKYLITNAAVFASYADGITVTVATVGLNTQTTITTQPGWDFSQFSSMFTNADNAFMWILEILRRDTDPGPNPVGAVQETLTFTKSSGAYTVSSSLGIEPVISRAFTSTSFSFVTANPVIDLTLFQSTPSGITGSRLAAIGIDALSGSVPTGGIDSDGVTVYPGFDCGKMRPRGYTLSVNPLISRETEISFFEVETDSGYVVSCAPSQINGGLPFTIPNRGSDIAGASTYFRLASIEGYGNVELSGTYLAAIITKESLEEFSTVSGLLGSAIHDPLILRSPAITGSVDRLPKGALLQIVNSNTSKAGVYPIELDNRGFEYVPFPNVLEISKEMNVKFPRVTAVDVNSITTDISLAAFPASGKVYFVLNESWVKSIESSEYAKSVIHADYSSRNDNTFFNLTLTSDALGALMPLIDFIALAKDSLYVTGLIDITLNLADGLVAGDVLAGGSLGLTDLHIENVLTETMPIPIGPINFSIANPAMVSAKPAPAYDNTPGLLHTALLATDLNILHNPDPSIFDPLITYPFMDMACILKSDVFTVKDGSGNPGFTGLSGLYLMRNYPRPSQDLNSVYPHAISNSYTGSSTGVWNPSLEEPVYGELYSSFLFGAYGPGDEDPKGALQLFNNVTLNVTSYEVLDNLIYTDGGDYDAFSIIRVGKEARYVQSAEGGEIRFFGNPLPTGFSTVEILPLGSSGYTEKFNSIISAISDVIWSSTRNFTTQQGAFVTTVNELRDTQVADLRTLGIQQGDFIWVQKEGKIQGPGGESYPVQYGRPSTENVFIGDDNRGYYQVKEIYADRIEVSCETLLLIGDQFTGDKTYKGVTYFPSIVGEGQGDLRVTAYASGTTFLTNDSIAPFSYQVLRPKLGVLPEDLEFALAVFTLVDTFKGEIEVASRVFLSPDEFASVDAINDPFNNGLLTEELYDRLFPDDIYPGIISYIPQLKSIELISAAITTLIKEGAFYERRYSLLDYRANRETGTKILVDLQRNRNRTKRRKRRSRGLFRRG